MSEKEPESTIATVRQKVIQYRINNRLTNLMVQVNDILKLENENRKIEKNLRRLIDELVVFNKLSNPQPEYELHEPVVEPEPVKIPLVIEIPVEEPVMQPYALRTYTYEPYIYQ